MAIPYIDPELRPILASFLTTRLDFSDEGIAQTRRALAEMIDSAPPPSSATVRIEAHQAPGPPGDPDVSLRIYLPRTPRPGGAALYWVHGGGMMIGSASMDDGLLTAAVEKLGIIAVAVEYRLAPEHPHPAPVEDCYAGLCWLTEHAVEFDIDPKRIAVGGPSAGGGLSAGTALLARDRGGPNIAFQLLLEPMLDDRCVTASSTAYDSTVVWDRHDNRRGWEALLGERVGSDDVPIYAAPARATDLAGLPSAFVDVGQSETFRDEAVAYAMQLMAANVPTELHVYPGAFHGFDLFAPESRPAQAAWRLRWDALARALAIGGPNSVSPDSDHGISPAAL